MPNKFNKINIILLLKFIKKSDNFDKLKATNKTIAINKTMTIMIDFYNIYSLVVISQS